LAVAVQALLALHYFAMGLGWAGFWWIANLVQGLGLLAVAVWAAIRKPFWALAAPVVSLGLLMVMLGGDKLVSRHVCSPEAKAAVAELGWLPNQDEDYYFVPEWGKGCVARFNSGLPSVRVIHHYRTSAAAAGWEETGSQSSSRAEVSDTAWTVQVWVNHNDFGMYVLRVFPRKR
jgi:hypothetical protein